MLGSSLTERRRRRGCLWCKSHHGHSAAGAASRTWKSLGSLTWHSWSASLRCLPALVYIQECRVWFLPEWKNKKNKQDKKKKKKQLCHLQPAGRKRHGMESKAICSNEKPFWLLDVGPTSPRWTHTAGVCLKGSRSHILNTISTFWTKAKALEEARRMSGAAATMNSAFCTGCTYRCWGKDIKRK